MIISATFRERIDTPIDIALLGNRIVNKKEAILGIIRGNLKYQKLIFNIYPKIAYTLGDKDFDKTLSLIQDFKRKDFMREGNKPYSITYKIAYALSNTHHIEYFAQKDYIDLPLLFHDIGRIYPPENSSITFKDDFLLNIGVTYPDYKAEPFAAYIDSGSGLCLAKYDCFPPKYHETLLDIQGKDISNQDIILRKGIKTPKILIDRYVIKLPSLYFHTTGCDSLLGNNFLQLCKTIIQNNVFHYLRFKTPCNHWITAPRLHRAFARTTPISFKPLT